MKYGRTGASTFIYLSCKCATGTDSDARRIRFHENGAFARGNCEQQFIPIISRPPSANRIELTYSLSVEQGRTRK